MAKTKKKSPKKKKSKDKKIDYRAIGESPMGIFQILAPEEKRNRMFRRIQDEAYMFLRVRNINDTPEDKIIPSIIVKKAMLNENELSIAKALEIPLEECKEFCKYMESCKSQSKRNAEEILSYFYCAAYAWRKLKLVVNMSEELIKKLERQTLIDDSVTAKELIHFAAGTAVCLNLNGIYGVYSTYICEDIYEDTSKSVKIDEADDNAGIRYLICMITEKGLKVLKVPLREDESLNEIIDSFASSAEKTLIKLFLRILLYFTAENTSENVINALEEYLSKDSPDVIKDTEDELIQIYEEYDDIMVSEEEMIFIYDENTDNVILKRPELTIDDFQEIKKIQDETIRNLTKALSDAEERVRAESEEHINSLTSELQISRDTISNLKSELQEKNTQIENLSNELNSVRRRLELNQRKLEESENLIEPLKAQIYRYENEKQKKTTDNGKMHPHEGSVILKTSETEFYESEIRDFVIKAIIQAAESINNTKSDGSADRKRDILRDLIANNHVEDNGKDDREAIKNFFTKNPAPKGSESAALIRLGFSSEMGGAHQKIVYHDDPRYAFTLGHTPSDSRCAGRNMASIIVKALFG